MRFFDAQVRWLKYVEVHSCKANKSEGKHSSYHVDTRTRTAELSINIYNHQPQRQSQTYCRSVSLLQVKLSITVTWGKIMLPEPCRALKWRVPIHGGDPGTINLAFSIINHTSHSGKLKSYTNPFLQLINPGVRIKPPGGVNFWYFFVFLYLNFNCIGLLNCNKNP